MSDFAIGAIQDALDGLAARQRITAENLANADTPGYLASNVTFEDSLRKAVSAGNLDNFGVGTTKSLEPTNQNGNNVNVDEETVSLIDTGLQYQTMTTAMNNEFHLLSEAINK